MGISHQASLFNRLSQPRYAGIRFVLIGYKDPDTRDRISKWLVLGGAVDAGGYSEDCTHVIVHNIEYDDPVCVTARQDGKVLVSGLWVDHSFAARGPVSTDSVIYVPPRNLKGIPGAESLVVCLTGYQQDYRKYIRVMAHLMGAEFTQPINADKVTHLICYKFEGQTYEAAKKIKRIKLVNHKWLEDCLRKWEILREEDYSKSGHDLEAEALLKQVVSRSQLNSSACRLFSNAENVVSATIKSSCDLQKSSTPNMENNEGGAVTNFKTGKRKSLGTECLTSSLTLGKKKRGRLDDENGRLKCKMEVSNGCPKQRRISLDDDITIRESSHVESGQELRKNPQADTAAKSPGKIIPSKTIASNSSEGLKGNDVSSDISYLNNSAATSPAKDTPSKTTERMSPVFKGKNVTGDVVVFKMPAPEIVQRPQKDYRETSLVTKVDNSGTGVAVNVMQGLVLKNSVICVRPRDFNGIPGAESLVVCLTGYRGDDKKNIMVMLQSMGAGFTEKLKPDTVTHLLCYKFEGQKYEVAKKLERIKLVNHKWLEDCLRRWEILPEYYLESGHDLKMEAEALLKQEVSRSLLNTSACRFFSNAKNVVSATIKSSCDLQKSSTPNLENNDGGAVTNFKSVKQKSLGKKFLVRSPTLDKRKTARLDDENGRFKWKMEVSNGCPKLRRISLDDDISIRESSYVESGQELRKNPQADSVAKSPGKITPSKTIVRNSSEGLKGNDVPADISYLNNSAATSPAKDAPSKTTKRMSPDFNGKNVTGDVVLSKMHTTEIVQRPQKDYRETSLVTKVDNSGTGVAVNVMQALVLKNSVICVRPRDLNGIPGAESLVVCLTGYRGDDKKNIMVMLQSMGAGFMEKLKPDTVTHLLCYKFEGQKYEAAKKLARIKLVNHKWLEDCLSRWEILPEYYLKSGHDLKMEGEALLKQEVSRSLLNTSACRLFNNAENVVSETIKSSCDLQKSSSPNLENNDGGAVTNFKSVKRKSLGKKFLVRSLTLDKRKTARLDDENGRFKWKMEVSNGCPKLRRISLDDNISIRESSYVESGQELRKNPQADSFAKSPGKITPSKTIVRNSSEGVKGSDVPADISYLNNSAATSPAKDTPSKTTKRMSPDFNGKNVTGDVVLSKMHTTEIVQRPQKDYRETSLVTKVDNSDTGVAVNVMQGPVLTYSVICVKPRDLFGIPGAESLVVCLSGYQRDDVKNIMVMVQSIGAGFTAELKPDTVTHLLCYKFEGQTYEAAKRMKRIKLVNHKWLEDCLRRWEILPEEDYSKSGHDLKMEAEALLKQEEVSRSLSNTSACRGFSKAENVVSETIKSSSDLQKFSTSNLENNDEGACTIADNKKRILFFGRSLKARIMAAQMKIPKRMMA